MTPLERETTYTNPQPIACRRQTNHKKRKLSDMHQQQQQLHISLPFKIRALLIQLRPLFLEVLRTPDFRNCRAAHEIKLQMKLLMELHKQMTLARGKKGDRELEGDKKGNVELEGQHSLHESKTSAKQERERERPKLHKPEQSAEKVMENGTTSLESSRSYSSHTKDIGIDIDIDIDIRIRGTYILGGSPSGRNFITYTGTKPEYYGVTKESYLRSFKN